GSPGLGSFLRASVCSDEPRSLPLSPRRFMGECPFIDMETSTTLNRALSERHRGARIIRKRRRTFWFTGSRAWSLVAFVVVAIAFLSVPSENKYPGALVGAFVFFLVQFF